MEAKDELVNRFLRWRLPKDVRPDGDPNGDRLGTNLLTADQAKQMLEFVLDGFEVKSKEEYKELIKRSGFLNALECCGVDNWSGYGDAQEMFSKPQEE